MNKVYIIIGVLVALIGIVFYRNKETVFATVTGSSIPEQKDYTFYYGRTVTIVFNKDVQLYYEMGNIPSNVDIDTRAELLGKGRRLVGILGKGKIEGATATVTNAGYEYPVSFLLSDIETIGISKF